MSVGTISWRNPATGSWFIQSLCNVFQKHALEWPLSDIMLKVNEKIASEEDRKTDGKVAKQMSDFGQNTLRMKLYFKPEGPYPVTT